MTASRIDTHHHHYPPEFLAAVDDVLRRTTHAHYERLKRWVPNVAIEAMDRTGIDISVLSIATPNVWLGDVDASRALARACNEYAARMQSDHKGRFGHFACLALPDVDGSLREIEHSFDVLKADGIVVTTNYDDKHLGEERFAPILQDLNRRGAVVYVHPTPTTYAFGAVAELPAPILEFPFDTTRTIASLLFSGSFSRYPNIRWIFSHGGGAIGPLVTRLEGLARNNPRLAERAPDGVTKTLSKIYLDVVAVTPGALRSILDLVPVSQLLFGTDMPFWSPTEAIESLENLHLPAADVAAIERDNALKLLPHLKR